MHGHGGLRGRFITVAPGCSWLRALGFQCEVLGKGGRQGIWQRGVGGREGGWTGKAEGEEERRGYPRCTFRPQEGQGKEERGRARMEEASPRSRGQGG